MSLWREWYLRIEYLPLIGYLHFVAQDDSGVAVKEEDWRDLIYEAERTDPTTGKRYRPIPMLAPFNTEWYTQRVRNAWRGYVTMMLCECFWCVCSGCGHPRPEPR